MRFFNDKPSQVLVRNLVRNSVLKLVKVALSCQCGEELALCKKKSDLILREMSGIIPPFSPLCTSFWTIVDKELTLLVNKKCDPRYLSIILHSRYRAKLYKRYSEKKYNILTEK